MALQKELLCHVKTFNICFHKEKASLNVEADLRMIEKGKLGDLTTYFEKWSSFHILFSASNFKKKTATAEER